MDTPQKMIPFLRFGKNDVMTFNNQLIFSKELIEVLNNASYKHKVVFGYDKNMTFGEYIRKKVFLNSLNRAKNEKVLKDNSEFIY
jgi:predicted TIM-barrel fold metal-dependent hydrolase